MNEARAPRRWGAAATLLWSTLLMAFFFAMQGAIAVAYISLELPGALPAAVEREVLRLQGDGDMLAAVVFLTTPLCVAALFAVVRLKRGAVLHDTLALAVPSMRSLGRWVAAMAALAAASDLLSVALGKPVVPELIERTWRSSGDKASLVAAVVVAAPLLEELLFRGFLMSGLATSRWPPWAAVLVAAGSWAAIHTQYDLYGILTIFAMGLLLGVARLRTGSTLVPMAMHAFANAWALAEAMIVAGRSMG